MFKQAEWRLTNSFATSINDILSTIAWFSCINEKALSLFWVIAGRSYVLSRLNIENDLSTVGDVEPFVETILVITTTILINSLFSWDKDWMTLTSSSSLIGWDLPQMT